MHCETVLDENGVLRWKVNKAVRWLLELQDYQPLNRLSLAGIPEQDRRELYRLMGYSISGYMEIFNETDVDEATEALRLYEEEGYVGKFTYLGEQK